MRIHHEPLGDVIRYIEDNKHIRIEDKRTDFEYLLNALQKFKTIGPGTKILEIGTGIGWFPILCKLAGISCKGIEISPTLVEYAHSFGKEYGVEPDIELGNIEELDIGNSVYDIIVALSIFEHVENWEKGLRRVFTALKPGGMLYFTSTNKYSFRSGEYSFPLYGWLPDNWRYRLRKARQGEDIMKLGIDFNQFTYFQLRKFFNNIGFSKVFDRIEILNSSHMDNQKIWKRIVLKIFKEVKVLKNPFLHFSNGTFFICIK